jgi:hypothetical protein
MFKTFSKLFSSLKAFARDVPPLVRPNSQSPSGKKDILTEAMGEIIETSIVDEMSDMIVDDSSDGANVSPLSGGPDESQPADNSVIYVEGVSENMTKEDWIQLFKSSGYQMQESDSQEVCVVSVDSKLTKMSFNFGFN